VTKDTPNDEGDFESADWIFGAFPRDAELGRLLDSLKANEAELSRLRDASTDEAELSRLLESLKPDEAELSRLLEYLKPDDAELSRLLDDLRPDDAALGALTDSSAQTDADLRRIVEELKPDEEELARIFDQLRDDPDLQQRLDQLPAAAIPPEPRTEASPAEVAQWMHEQLRERGTLFQSTVAFGIQRRFGSEHVYINKNRNLAVSRDVLAEFRVLTPDVVWERRKRVWRIRRETDPADRRQVD